MWNDSACVWELRNSTTFHLLLHHPGLQLHRFFSHNCMLPWLLMQHKKCLFLFLGGGAFSSGRTVSLHLYQHKACHCYYIPLFRITESVRKVNTLAQWKGNCIIDVACILWDRMFPKVQRLNCWSDGGNGPNHDFNDKTSVNACNS
jgi:hypothetical protein